MTALVGLAWFGAYLVSLTPTVGAEDAGEFAAAAWSLGVGHAPGYPLHALVGRLAMALPLGDPAFRLNLLSAASAAAACAMLFAMVRIEAAGCLGSSRTMSIAAGLLASAAFGFGRAIWHQATISDKYAFHLMLHAAVCVAACRGLRPAVLGLLAGIALGHHLQIVYVLPGLAWLLIRRRLPARTWALLVGVLVVGMSPKLVYPPIRAASGPALMLAAPVTVGRHLAYLRTASYAGRIAGPLSADRWRDLWQQVRGETAGLGWITGLAGLLLVSRSAGPVARFVWPTIATGLVLSASLAITGREFYLLPVLWWLAAGTGWLLSSGRSRLRRIGWLAVPVALAAGLALPIANFNWYARSRMTLERDLGYNMLRSLPPRTALFASGDDVLFPLFYLQSVLGVRPDVVVIPEGFLGWPPARARIVRALPESARLLAAPASTASEDGWSRAVAGAGLAAGRPVALTNPSRSGLVAGLHREVRDVLWEVYAARPAFPDRPPRGLVIRGWWVPADALSLRQQWIVGLYAKYQRQDADRLANGGHARAALPRFRLALANPFLADRAGAGNNFGLALERAGDRDGALAAYRTALADPEATAEIWINAGNLLLGLGRRDEARTLFAAGLGRAAPGSVHAAYLRRQLARLGAGKPGP